MLRSLVGALLSMLIDPIYYRSIIVGSLYQRESMERALFRRIEQVKDMSAPYRCHSPSIYGTSNVDMRTTARAPFHALIWNCVDEQCEFIETYTGLTPSRRIKSMLCLSTNDSWSLFSDSIHRFQASSVRAMVSTDEQTRNNNCAHFVFRCEAISSRLPARKTTGKTLLQASNPC
jgi:hypothetical protein